MQRQNPNTGLAQTLKIIFSICVVTVGICEFIHLPLVVGYLSQNLKLEVAFFRVVAVVKWLGILAIWLPSKLLHDIAQVCFVVYFIGAISMHLFSGDKWLVVLPAIIGLSLQIAIFFIANAKPSKSIEAHRYEPDSLHI